MLYYYNQELSFDELINNLLPLEGVSLGYILISDPQLYSTFHSRINLSLHNIHNLPNFQLILIESWSEIDEFISSINKKCLIVLYGIIKSFVEIGHSEEELNGGNETKDVFLQPHQFCAWELNKLFHKMFVQHLKQGINILVNDSIGQDENGSPLIWNIKLPNIRTQVQLSDEPEKKLSLRVIFIKWFKIINHINDIVLV